MRAYASGVAQITERTISCDGSTNLAFRCSAFVVFCCMLDLTDLCFGNSSFARAQHMWCVFMFSCMHVLWTPNKSMPPANLFFFPR